MNRITFCGDVKRVTETLEALAELHHDGISIMELAEKFDGMTDEQKGRYIELVTGIHRQFGGRSGKEEGRMRRA